MTNYKLNLTNKSRVCLYAFEATPIGETEVTLTSDVVEIPAGQTVQIASFDPPHTDSWGWISIGLGDQDRAYQVYCERTYDGYNSYAQFGYYDASNTEPKSNNSPFPDGVSVCSLGSDSYEYTFNGEMVPYELALGPYPGGDAHVWQFYDALTHKWVPLLGVIASPPSQPQTSCGIVIDGVMTTVELTIRNSTGQPFIVNVVQDGTPLWSGTVLVSVAILVDLQLVSGASSVLEITGQYSDGRPIPGLNTSGSLPDPTFKITRKGS